MAQEKVEASLKNILDRQVVSTNVQNSAVKMLNSIVNDMLDYAQLSTGQFKKCYSRFNLVESIGNIVEIMNYKATELGLKIVQKFENFPESVGESLNTMSEQGTKIMVGFDNQRLQQIVLNLLSNAIKFTPYGQVKITSRLVSSAADLSVKDDSFRNILQNANGTQYLEV